MTHNGHKNHHRGGRRPKTARQQNRNSRGLLLQPQQFDFEYQSEDKSVVPSVLLSETDHQESLQSDSPPLEPPNTTPNTNHPEFPTWTFPTIEPKALLPCPRISPQLLSELRDHGHHPLLQVNSHRGKDLFQMLLDNVPWTNRKSALQQQAIEASRRLSGNHFSIHKGRKSTEKIIESYMPILDDLFFFGTLKNETTLSWKQCVEWNGEKPTFQNGYVVPDDNGDAIFRGMSGTYSKSNKHRPKCFITMTRDMNSHPGHEDYVIDNLGLLIHEMLHGFTERFECKNNKKCCKESLRLNCQDGHAAQFYAVCKAMENSANEILGLRSCIRTESSSWNRQEGVSWNDRTRSRHDENQRTFVQPGRAGITKYEKYKRIKLAEEHLYFQDTEGLVRKLCGWEEPPRVFGSWDMFMPDDLLLERFIIDFELDGKCIFAFLSDHEADFWLSHCRKMEYPEHYYLINMIRKREEKLVGGEMAQGWLPFQFRRAEFRQKSRKGFAEKAELKRVGGLKSTNEIVFHFDLVGETVVW